MKFIMTIALLLGRAVSVSATAQLAEPHTPPNSQPIEQSFQNGFASLVPRTVTAVVTIGTTEAGTFGEEFIDPPPAARRGDTRSLGSGVIVSPNGYILTNDHIINRVSDIRILLWDNRELTAQLVGSDPKTDIAVLRIDAGGLPSLPFGKSSLVRPGDLALAIGAPFGLGQTLTMGVVSATARRGLGIQPYENFIQTDAAIHHGSSGGALVNLRGELIGIITAGKEYAGVGFAVPIDMARDVLQQILTRGRVARGWLGITGQALTTSTARIFGLAGPPRGVLVTEVATNSPANRAGILPGDIIIEIDNATLRDGDDLNLVIGSKQPGSRVRLTTYRDGNEAAMTVSIEEEPLESQEDAEPKTVRHEPGPLGLSVQTVTPDISADLALRKHTRGVVVTDVESASRAAAAKLSEGDIVLEVARHPVTNTEEFLSALRRVDAQPVLLLIERSGTRLFVVVE